MADATRSTGSGSSGRGCQRVWVTEYIREPKLADADLRAYLVLMPHDASTGARSHSRAQPIFGVAFASVQLLGHLSCGSGQDYLSRLGAWLAAEVELATQVAKLVRCVGACSYTVAWRREFRRVMRVPKRLRNTLSDASANPSMGGAAAAAAARARKEQHAPTTSRMVPPASPRADSGGGAGARLRRAAGLVSREPSASLSRVSPMSTRAGGLLGATGASRRSLLLAQVAGGGAASAAASRRSSLMLLMQAQHPLDHAAATASGMLGSAGGAGVGPRTTGLGIGGGRAGSFTSGRQAVLRRTTSAVGFGTLAGGGEAGGTGRAAGALAPPSPLGAAVASRAASFVAVRAVAAVARLRAGLRSDGPLLPGLGAADERADLHDAAADASSHGGTGGIASALSRPDSGQASSPNAGAGAAPTPGAAAAPSPPPRRRRNGGSTPCSPSPSRVHRAGRSARSSCSALFPPPRDPTRGDSGASEPEAEDVEGQGRRGAHGPGRPSSAGRDSAARQALLASPFPGALAAAAHSFRRSSSSARTHTHTVSASAALDSSALPSRAHTVSAVLDSPPATSRAHTLDSPTAHSRAHAHALDSPATHSRRGTATGITSTGAGMHGPPSPGAASSSAGSPRPRSAGRGWGAGGFSHTAPERVAVSLVEVAPVLLDAEGVGLAGGGAPRELRGKLVRQDSGTSLVLQDVGTTSVTTVAWGPGDAGGGGGGGGAAAAALGSPAAGGRTSAVALTAIPEEHAAAAAAVGDGWGARSAGGELVSPLRPPPMAADSFWAARGALQQRQQHPHQPQPFAAGFPGALSGGAASSASVALLDSEADTGAAEGTSACALPTLLLGPAAGSAAVLDRLTPGAGGGGGQQQQQQQHHHNHNHSVLPSLVLGMASGTMDLRPTESLADLDSSAYGSGVGGAGPYGGSGGGGARALHSSGSIFGGFGAGLPGPDSYEQRPLQLPQQLQLRPHPARPPYAAFGAGSLAAAAMESGAGEAEGAAAAAAIVGTAHVLAKGGAGGRRAQSTHATAAVLLGAPSNAAAVRLGRARSGSAASAASPLPPPDQGGCGPPPRRPPSHGSSPGRPAALSAGNLGGPGGLPDGGYLGDWGGNLSQPLPGARPEARRAASAVPGGASSGGGGGGGTAALFGSSGGYSPLGSRGALQPLSYGKEAELHLAMFSVDAPDPGEPGPQGQGSGRGRTGPAGAEVLNLEFSSAFATVAATGAGAGGHVIEHMTLQAKHRSAAAGAGGGVPVGSNWANFRGSAMEALATSHSCVTILFCDIIGFTNMCKEVSAMTVMRFLNTLYMKFDELIDIYGTYKVETIGDCYMVAGGLVRTDGEGNKSVIGDGSEDALHAVRVMSFAKDAPEVVEGRGATVAAPWPALLWRAGGAEGMMKLRGCGRLAASLLPALSARCGLGSCAHGAQGVGPDSRDPGTGAPHRLCIVLLVGQEGQDVAVLGIIPA
ncbi:Soluble guanylate cyclase gcy-31 [Tetrabaena socialis]|uniref:Soluble guanylate cyclase gcy-31 n=1 Tax=Tetrabaena socialis TaxID=47790 RepID=A0A2J8AJW3_9CHLO|nr:Soluble guanylate cyclase gcy-31 [Tetrabaena socialis]|eukprot:PNH12807.1 Soluble guanylate cyclase gcy-31 [Tetrabaena socialis]